MIARVWHGVTRPSDADEYLGLMQDIALPDYRAIPGNLGAYALRSIEGDRVHFLMLTFWESEEAISRFAGTEIAKAKYYDFDSRFLLELEPSVTHYEAFDR